MDFSFDELITRRGSGSVKWDEMPSDDVLPLWVADMDFRAAPCIMDALRRRVEHGVFGYTFVDERYYDAIIRWFQRRHNWTINRDWIIYTTGVVPAISATLKALAKPGEKVAILTPVYNCFFSSIRNNQLQALEVPLLDDAQRIDFDALAEVLADPSCTVLLFCNPHNPGGRVWRQEELERVAELCAKNGVWLVSDEIHCELVFQGSTFTPFASLPTPLQSRTVTFNSPSKNFNTAGLQVANIICEDEDVRRRIDRAINDNEVCDVNPLGVEALIAAYNEGESWLEELLVYLHENYKFLCGFAKDNLKSWRVLPLEGTYLAWVDVSASGIDGDTTYRRLLNDAHVAVNAGSMYGKSGKNYIRMNLACPRKRLEEALVRIAKTLS